MTAQDKGGEKTEQSPIKEPSATGERTTVDTDLDAAVDESLFVVGLGASAGGLESFERFFTNLPPDSGLSFVVTVHLDPHHKTLLPELLSRYTRMEVVAAEEGMTVEPNRVYIIPSNRDMTISSGQLHLDEQLQPRGMRYTIDQFLRSLADDLGDRSAAVILSGTGSDGTQGAKAIKLAGGVVIVEDEQSAKYPGMPHSAIASGVVDLVLPTEQIGEKLIELTSHHSRAKRKGNRPEQDISKNLRTIYRIVNSHTGHDFSAYKINTIVRRIDRRMAINNIGQVEDYIDLIKEGADECRALVRDVLIGVTSFFRDEEAFSTLETEVIPKLFADRDPDNPVRIWLAGCATGEEAYSVAILVREHLREHHQDCKVQIFASDLDAEAIEHARAGNYPQGISADLSEQRLKNYFRKAGDRYEVVKSLREMIVFAQHNLIKDPPFSRLDLLICRNLLIYLSPEVQKRILPLFYQSLRPGRYLFLGSSETVGSFNDLFQSISKKWKIFQRREAGRRVGFELPVAIPEKKVAEGEKTLARQGQAPPKPGQVAEQILIQRYSPPCVVINDKQDVLYYSTRTARFLEPPVGEPTQNILRMAHEDLRPALRAAIHKAQTTQQPVVYSDLRVRLEDSEESVRLCVEPLTRPSSLKGLALVIFETGAQQTVLVEKEAQPPRPVDGDEKDQIIAQLEEQLRLTHEELQTTIEQLESSNEELKSSNEELMSMNEEFQSTNEELETSKEELQALNEELVTVNTELESKVEELGQANDDMQNLLTSSEVATIFLDRELRVKRYTPHIAALFNLIESDIGRPLQHISGQVAYPDLVRDAEQVLDSLAPIERVLSSVDGHFYLMRMLPYRTQSDQIDGVVVALTDISSRRQMEEYRAQLATMVEVSIDPIFRCSMDGSISSWNAGAEVQFGYSAEQMIGKNILQLVTPDEQNKLEQHLKKLEAGRKIKNLQIEMLRKDQKLLQVELSISPIYNAAGEPTALATVARDISKLVKQKRELAEKEKLYRTRANELAALMESVPAAVWIAEGADCRIITGNQMSYELLRQPRNVNLSKSAPEGETPLNFKVYRDGRELTADELPMQTAARTGKPVKDFMEEIVFEDGSKVSVIGNSVPLFDEEGQVTGAVAAFIDISALKEAEEQLRLAKEEAEQANQVKSDFLGNVSHEVRTPLTGLMSMLDLLKETQLDEEQQKLHSLAERATQALLEVINDILDFARLEAGKLQINPEPFELCAWAEAIIRPFELKYRDRPYRLSMTYDQSLPVVAVSDPTRLTQVLNNLLENACKFTEEGEIEVSLNPASQQPAQADTFLLELSVRDTGIGIPHDQQETLFESFTQADSSLSREKGGIGLGLSISKKIIELLGGRIEVTSQVGQGSTFTCTVPCSRIGDLSVPDKGRQQSPSQKNLTVLLVEDDEIIAEGLKKKLDKIGWQVSVAENGARALEFYQKEAFDLVLMDVQMPGMDGLEATSRIRELSAEENRQLIIGLTAHGRPEDKKKCYSAGMDAVLLKPVELSRLRELVDDLLAGGG